MTVEATPTSDRLLDELTRLSLQEDQLANLALQKATDPGADEDDHQVLLVTSLYHSKLSALIGQAINEITRLRQLTN